MPWRHKLQARAYESTGLFALVQQNFKLWSLSPMALQLNTFSASLDMGRDSEQRSEKELV